MSLGAVVGRNDISKPWYTKSTMPSEIKAALSLKPTTDGTKDDKKSSKKAEEMSKSERKLLKKERKRDMKRQLKELKR